MSKLGKHRKTTVATRNFARAAVAGLAVSAPLAMATTPANAQEYNPNWDMLAQCESGGNWSINTGNGYYGGVQFSHSTWQAYGGSGYAHENSKAEQIRIATKVLNAAGPNQWPACTSKTGWHQAGGGSAPAPEPQPEPKSQPQQESKPEAPSASPQVARVAKSNPDGDYEVKKGDTLSEIAADEDVKGGWEKLHELNEEFISDPDFIVVGQKIATK